MPSALATRGRVCHVMVAVAILNAFRLVQTQPTHTIIDAKADIEDLDVGDLDDMESDVTPMFLEEQKKKKNPVKMPSMADMKDPMEWAANSNSGMQMSFATLKQEEAEKLQKQGTEVLASRWKAMLETGGVNANIFSIDPGKVLFTVNGPGLIWKIKEFVLQQPETDWFEYQQKQFYPEGRSHALMDNSQRKAREIELGWRKPDPPKEDEKKKKAKKRRKSKKSE
mmetsp:Transcript_85527/g.155779  ORF Transcript_85527/g.155779 Transcript_85527/m.155779 type:complete len:225 (-) Transcript_85527:50-724(-)